MALLALIACRPMLVTTKSPSLMTGFHVSSILNLLLYNRDGGI